MINREEVMEKKKPVECGPQTLTSDQAMKGKIGDEVMSWTAPTTPRFVMGSGH